MKKIFWSLTCIALVFLSSCVTFSKEFPASSPVDTSQAYIFGVFRRTNNTPVAYLTLNIRNVENGKEYVIPFSENYKAYSLQIVPGTYIISRILSVGTLKDKMGEFQLTSSYKGLSNRFSVEPGTLLYIGDYKGSITNSFTQNYVITRTSVDSIEDNFDSTLEELLRNKINFNILTARNLLAE